MRSDGWWVVSKDLPPVYLGESGAESDERGLIELRIENLVVGDTRLKPLWDDCYRNL